MEIIILGNGKLGIYLNNFFEEYSQVKVLPLSTTSISEFKNELKVISSPKIFLDLMDPNKIDQSTKNDFLQKASNIRNLIKNYSNIKHYIFLSSANLYENSLNKIIEDDPIIEKNLSEYLKLKKNSENILNQSNIPLSICRIPNIWGHDTNDSFFHDLLRAFHSNSHINYRDGDENIISYINIYDLCKLLLAIIKNRIYGLINISTESYDSRYNLKAKVNKDNLIKIDTLNGIRLTSKNLIYSKYIKKLELPF